MNLESFTTDTVWNLANNEKPIERGDIKFTPESLPYITDPKTWEQYTDQVTYEIDKELRAFYRKMETTAAWKKSYLHRKYTSAQLFMILFGREYDKAKDSKAYFRLGKIMAYYSTKIQKNQWVPAKQKTVRRNVYIFAAQPTKRPAYSLRLRVEEMASKGLVPKPSDLRLPKDNLAPGHARNPLTEANMRKREEEFRRKFNEYQRERNARISAEQNQAE